MAHISLARQVPEAGRLFQLAARAPFLPVREVGLALTATPECSLREHTPGPGGSAPAGIPTRLAGELDLIGISRGLLWGSPVLLKCVGHSACDST